MTEIIYGRNCVRECLVAGSRPIEKLLFIDRQDDQLARDRGVSTEFVRAQRMAEIVGHTDHQGVAAWVGAFPYASEEDVLAYNLVLVLDQVQDPHNLGAAARVAEAVGAAVVIPERRAASVTAAVCSASAGAVEHLRIHRARNIADFLQKAKSAEFWVYGLDAEADTAYTTLEYDANCVFVMGSEHKGLRPRVAASCDQLLSIPMSGKVQSLNVSTAAAVVLFEVVRQRPNSHEIRATLKP